jgi:hypothetical protein
MANGSSDDFTSGLEEALQARESLVQDYADQTTEILNRAGEEQAAQVVYFQNLMANAVTSGQAAQLKSYQSCSQSAAKLLGLGIKEQALIMAPFEIAESVKEFAKFLSTGDPMALASSAEHALAAALYIKAAGAAGGGGGGSGGGGGGAGAKSQTGTSAPQEPERTGKIIIEGAKRDANEVIQLTSEQLYKMVDALNRKWKEGSIILDFAR